MFLKSSMVFILGFSAISLQSKADSSFGDWEVIDASCVARTATYLNSSVYSLNIMIDKSGKRPVEVLLRPEGSKNSSVKGFTAITDKGNIYSFAKLSKNSSGQDLFWNLPLDTARFVSEMKGVNQLNVTALGGVGELPFSMSGITAAMNELQSRCGSSALKATSVFESAFVPAANVKRVALSNLTPDNANQAREIVARGLVAHKGVLGVQAEIDGLEAKFKALIDERKVLISTLVQLNDTLNSLTNGRNTAQATIDNANAEIASLTAAIADSNNQLAIAQTNYQNAFNARQPFVPEHDRLEGIMGDRHSTLRSAQNRQAQIEQGIANDQNQIANLNQTFQDLNGQLDSLRNQEYEARNDADRAANNLRSFDYNSEVQRLKSQNGRVYQLERELSGLQAQSSRSAAEVQQAARDRDAASQALQRCASGHASYRLQDKIFALLIESASAFDPRGQGQGRGGPGGPGGAGHQQPPPVVVTPPPVVVAPPVTVAPPPPPPPAAPNCSAQSSALGLAENRLAQAQASSNRDQYQLNNSTNEYNQLIGQIQGQAAQEQRELEERAHRTRERVGMLRNQENQTSERMQSITNVELPNTRNDLSDLQGQLPGAISDVANAQQAADQADAAFENYKRSVNYDELDRQVHVTLDKVNEIKYQIAKMQRQVRVDQQTVIDQTNLRDNLIKKIATTNLTISQKQTRLSQVQALLLTHDQLRSDLDTKMTAAVKVRTDIQSELIAILPQK